MIIKTFEFSAAAAAAAVNVCPSDFNPIPAAGMIDVFAVLDGGIAGPLTVPPTVEIVRGGSTSDTPVRKGSITGSPAQSAGTTVQAGNFTDPSLCPVITGMPVAQGTNLQINLAGGTGATATGRMRVVFRTPDEIRAGVGASGNL